MKAKQPANDYFIWQNEVVAQNFLKGVRGAIPLAQAQIDCLLRVVTLTQSRVTSFLDLGCGDGILGRAIADQYPEAKGIFIDISESMLAEAQNKFTQINASKENNQESRYQFLLQDFGNQNWLKALTNSSNFDVIVSGFAIHHQPDQRKQEIYHEVYNLLNPGGIFLNLEHVASRSELGEQAFDQLFVDKLYEYHRQVNQEKSRQAIANNYYSRHDQNANILTLVETQCDWLREIGFLDVDCFLKLFEIALFGGIKPLEIKELD